MSSKLVKRLQRYRKSLTISLVWHENGYLHLFLLFWGKELKEIEIFLNFRVGRHLPTGMLKFKTFGHSSACEGEYALPCEISSKLVKPQ